ncbi:UDP-glucuronosyl/UDP-glucosyltransferase [Macleaya cordata]|uniref:Glycosyltransferase n=1 Tax=Macleaya cordata TaxID=56857 RepID=A0A200QKA0_MACCD|nr:UDP-glucuronosyl/UDP-glucosyltransferase [Macleaya cordata]
MENPKKFHVAILPCPGMGHIIPHLEFAKLLVTLHDFQVTFFVLSTDASAAQSEFLRSQTLPEGLHIHHLPPLDISAFVSNSTEIQSRISIIIRESIPDLQSAILNSLDFPNVFIFDFFATDAFEIADKLGIPKYIFFTSPALELAFMMYLPTLDREIHGEFIDLHDPVPVPGCTPIRIDDLVDPLRNRTRDSYKWFLHHASRFSLVDGILINTCQDLEPTTLKALREDPILRQIPTPRVYPVGPLIKLDKPKTRSEYMTWLDMQPNDSVLFISFGSGGTLSAGQITELAWGLELSQKRFIWVVRKPFEEDASGTFFNVGGEENDPSQYLPDGFLSRINGVGMVIQSWAPQAEIVSHSSIGGFITHCGWNSSLESIYNGVPMIAWPLYAEQWMNATMLTEELGVAVRAGVKREKGSVVGREEIERVVRLVMEEGKEGKDLRSRDEEFQKILVRDLDEGGCSYNSLSEVVKEWKGSTGSNLNIENTKRN